MNKLLTAGCSFTKHCWPTWADYLGKNVSWHKQLGLGGADNASIARSIISTAKKSDTVVVMWTGYDRWSLYDNGWQHKGCLVVDKNFYGNFYNPIERFTTSMDYVQMVDNHAKLKGYKCYHFSAFPWLQSELINNNSWELAEIYNNYSIENNFLMDIDLLTFQKSNNEVIPVTHKYTTNDIHPTPITHWKFLNQVISPIVDIAVDQSNLAQVNQDQTDVIAGNIL